MQGSLLQGRGFDVMLNDLPPSAGGYTQYENAVMGVGQVIEFYDAGR